MMNVRNFGVVEGRLTREPAVFTNKDGSKKIKLTLAVQDNFKSKDADGKPVKNSQFVQLDAYLPAARAKGNTVYDLINKGDMIGVQYSVRSNVYVTEGGETVYGQVLQVESVDLKETKATVAARAAKAEAPAEADDDTPFAE